MTVLTSDGNLIQMASGPAITVFMTIYLAKFATLAT